MRMKDVHNGKKQMGAMISDGDAAFLEKVIDQEKNLELKGALQELDEFLCE